ncbi:MAG: PEP-CTERM sorting domain-containing protein [Myxococcota bacterium]
MIDDFKTTQSASITSLHENGGGRLRSGTMLGGTRGLALQDSSGGAPLAVSIGSGSLGYVQQGSGQALMLLTWNGDPLGGELGGVDFTEGGAQDALALDVFFQDLGGLLMVTVCTDPAISGAQSCSDGRYSTGSTILGAGLHALKFSDFTLRSGSGADFTRVHQVVMRFQATGPGSLRLLGLATVPEPSAGVLTCVGVALLAGSRRRARRRGWRTWRRT